MSDTVESGLEPGGLRRLGQWTGVLERVLLIAAALVGIAWMLDAPTYLGVAFFPEQFVALFWALMLATVFLVCPAGRAAPRDRVPWYDALLFVVALANGLFVVFDYQRLLQTMEVPTPDKWISGALSLILLVEATRRITSPSLLWLLIGFVAYAAFAEWLPGMLAGNATSFARLVIYLAFDTNGLLGSTLFIIATIVLAYMLFGTVLNDAGGTRFFTDLSLAAMGRYRGGPAKVSVAGSTFFGAISGGAVTSVVTVGVITIPMMIRYGFRRESAAAIEAAASTGGQILPPVMGVAAFMMAELLNLPYATIALAALLPGLLYYVMLFVQVDLEAARDGLKGLPRADIPRAGAVLRAGWPFFVPIAVMLVVLFSFNYTAEKAALAAIVTALVIAAFKRETRPTPRRIAAMTIETSRGMLELAVVGAIIAIIIGSLNISGLGMNVVNALLALGTHSTFAMLVLAAVLALILGLGLPTLAVYLLLAVLLAPSIVKAGLDPLAVHLFLFYQGMMSMLSPPVAMAAFVAANIAGADPMRSGWTSMRIGAIAFVMPFVFVYSPELLLNGVPHMIAWVTLCTLAGGLLMTGALIGYLYRPIGWISRGVLALGAIACFLPHRFADGAGWIANVAGLALTVLLVLYAWRFKQTPA